MGFANASSISFAETICRRASNPGSLGPFLFADSFLASLLVMAFVADFLIRVSEDSQLLHQVVGEPKPTSRAAHSLP